MYNVIHRSKLSISFNLSLIPRSLLLLSLYLFSSSSSFFSVVTDAVNAVHFMSRVFFLWGRDFLRKGLEFRSTGVSSFAFTSRCAFETLPRAAARPPKSTVARREFPRIRRLVLRYPYGFERRDSSIPGLGIRPLVPAYCLGCDDLNRQAPFKCSCAFHSSTHASRLWKHFRSLLRLIECFSSTTHTNRVSRSSWHATRIYWSISNGIPSFSTLQRGMRLARLRTLIFVKRIYIFVNVHTDCELRNKLPAH